MPALLLPVALAALAALALPVLLHIARRSEQRLTDFAALRWLSERPKPRYRLRVDERLLLAIRLLLIALLALWLARPVLLDSADRTPWLVAAPGVDTARARSFVRGPAETRWLAPGFPPLAGPAPGGPIPTASLLREIDATLPPGVPLTVVVPAVLSGADGERPRLSRPVAWQIVPGAMPTADGIPLPAAEIALRYAPAASGARYIRAALAAAQPKRVDSAPVGAAPPHSSRRLVWLADGAVPDWLPRWMADGGTVLLPAGARLDAAARRVAWRDESGAPLVQEGAIGRGRWLRFTRPLVPSAIPQLLDPGFPGRVQALFAPPAAPPTRVRADAYAPATGGRPPARPMRDLQPIVGLLAGALFLAERWLATSRRRGVAP